MDMANGYAMLSCLLNINNYVSVLLYSCQGCSASQRLIETKEQIKEQINQADQIGFLVVCELKTNITMH